MLTPGCLLKTWLPCWRGKAPGPAQLPLHPLVVHPKSMEICCFSISWARVRAWSNRHHRVPLEVNTTTTCSRFDPQKSSHSSTQPSHLAPAYLIQRAWRRMRRLLATTTHTKACWPRLGRLMSSWGHPEEAHHPTAPRHTDMAATYGVLQQLGVGHVLFPLCVFWEIKTCMNMHLFLC